MDASISPICRFCLEENEEFHHLANDCPALYWDRQQIWAQEPQNQEWSIKQLLDFTYIPRINDAFVKPLYLTHHQRLQEIQSQTLPSQNPDDPDDSSQSDVSVMDAESLPDSSDQEMASAADSDIDVDNI